MNRLWGTIAATAAVAAFCVPGLGQTAEQPVELIIELDNWVTYRGDVTDATKLARDPGVTTPGPARAFQYTHNVADIVAVNGKPAKGLYCNTAAGLATSVNPQAGQMIADYDGGFSRLDFWRILAPDGIWIGTLLGGAAAPGGGTVTAGAGAFFGVIGNLGVLESIKPNRVASVSEDPANRRIHGGGKHRFILRLYPKYRPAVDITADGPAVFRAADFSPVTAVSPARGGEILTLAARNLGPVRPELLPPGSRVFKAEPVEVVNSPVEVTVNGKEAEVINKIGWPGTYDLYRVDFRVPSVLPPGTATLQLTAAWIPGPEVKIAVQ